MSETAFYLKYRPQKLEELDSDSVRESLLKIVSRKKIPHAFLFAGPKGTGKTSAARILAKIVNCESAKPPCNKCDHCRLIAAGSNIDVIELDAASNRGIDDIRSLRDGVKLLPARAKKKVYIIDEAHMLTTEASNALLKTLEEPPAHVMFILATTNPEKLIETIRSRVVQIFFARATPEETLHSLMKVVRGEKIKIGKEDLMAIVREGNGSFRDAVKILEQVVGDPKYLAKAKIFNADHFLEILAKKDALGALKAVEDFTQKGVAAANLIQALLLRLREALLAKVGIGREDLITLSQNDLVSLIELLSQAFQEIPAAFLEQLPLELAIIKWCGDGVACSEQRIANSEKEIKGNNKNVTTKLSGVTDDLWKTILSQVRPINTSIEALLRAARPVHYDGKTLTLGVYYKFHKERLEEGSHRRVLEDVVAGVLGNPVKVVCTLTEPPPKKETPPPTLPESVLTEGGDQDIIKIAEEIFGN